MNSYFKFLHTSNSDVKRYQTSDVRLLPEKHFCLFGGHLTSDEIAVAGIALCFSGVNKYICLHFQTFSKTSETERQIFCIGTY